MTKHILTIIMAFFITNAWAYTTRDSSNLNTDEDRLFVTASFSKYEYAWSRLVPKHAKIHYAGSMGFLSAGLGWDYGKRRNWETDLYIGYLPKFESTKNELTFTIKELYSPFRMPIRGNWNFEPLTVGFFGTWTTGEHLWGRLPEEYPKKYYYFTTAFRMNICVGERLTYNFDKKARIKALAFFYEFNTNDLYLTSTFDNANLGLSDILKLSFGMKIQFL